MFMEFRDLKKQYQNLKDNIDAGVKEVIASAQFISGTQIEILEKSLASYVGARHCITCGNGTDAITIALLAWNIGSGDAVFVPDFTFFSTGECPASIGATPIFVDVRKDTYNMDHEKLEEAIKQVISEGKYRPRVVVTVDLFGLPADYDSIRPICDKYGLLLLEDGAQGFGGELHGKRACSFGDISTTSFFPAKPLGCYGDPGALFTDDDNLNTLIRSICVHGKSGGDKYNNIRLGMNSRLDTLQAAILIPKLQAFQEYELDEVNRVAKMYTELLSDACSEVKLPIIEKGYRSSWAQYTVRLPNNVDRDAIQKDMKSAGIPTMVYYAKPMHRQRAFANTDSAIAECPITEELCKNVLCLPIHPYLSDIDCQQVVDTMKKVLCSYTS